MRNPTRKSTEGSTPANVMKKAVLEVVEGATQWDTARSYGISHSTLSRYFKKHNKDEDDFCPDYGKTNRTFTREQEGLLSKYLVTASKMHQGMTKRQARRLAFEYASKICATVPKRKTSLLELTGWKASEIETLRFPLESQRVPAQQGLPVLICRLWLSSSITWDQFTRWTPLSHTKFGTWMRPVLQQFTFLPKFLQVGHTTSAERGPLVTVIAVVNALGTFIPSMLVFPRVNFRLIIFTGDPTGSIGAANPSG